MKKMGKITKPKVGDRIDRVITVQGKLEAFLSHTNDGQSWQIIGNQTESLEYPKTFHIWLAMQNESDIFWVKEPEIKTRDWEIKIDYGNPTDDFSFILFAVGEEDHCTIENWFRFGKITGNYPGLNFKDIPTSQLLDKLEGLDSK